MQSRTNPIWGATWAVVLSALSPRAWADDAAWEIAPREDAPRVIYRGAPGCPDASAFLERLQVRSPAAVLVPEGSAAAFAVTVSSSAPESAARVERADGRGENVVRQVSGRTCDEVVSAAALITALGIEAQVATPVPLGAEPVQVGANVDRDVVREAPTRDASTWSIGAALGVDSWSAPGGAWSAGGFGELGATAPFRYVRLALRGATGSASIDQRRATFLLLAGGLSLCPVGLGLAARLELIPCAGIELGTLRGRGQESVALSNPRSASIFWAAGHVNLGLRWRVADAISLEMGGGLGFPLVRHSFVFEGPDQVIYELPAVGAGGAVAAMVHFR